MPMQRHLYPKDWNQIAFDVKERANWQCQHCGKICRKSGESLADFSNRMRGTDREVLEKPQRFTLTVAHLDHDPSNPMARLAALCSVCHLRYDRENYAANRKRNKAAQGNRVGTPEQC